MKRENLPAIDPKSIDVSMVPAHLQDKIRNLIVEKAESRINQEMQYLQDRAKEQISRFEHTDQNKNQAISFQPYYDMYGHFGSGQHPYGYPRYAGYGQVPFGMTKEQQEAYTKTALDQTLERPRSKSPQGKTGSQSPKSPKKKVNGKSPIRKNKKAGAESEVPKGTINLADDPQKALIEAGYPTDYYSNPKIYARERARAYDDSIKSDILLCGREGSMNITYDPFYHGPYHPYQFGDMP